MAAVTVHNMGSQPC